MPPINNCGNCTFALPHETDGAFFYCRRYPPSITKADSFIKDANCKLRIGRIEPNVSIGSHISQFPVVNALDWCGEYKP